MDSVKNIENVSIHENKDNIYCSIITNLDPQNVDHLQYVSPDILKLLRKDAMTDLEIIDNLIKYYESPVIGAALCYLRAIRFVLLLGSKKFALNTKYKPYLDDSEITEDIFKRLQEGRFSWSKLKSLKENIYSIITVQTLKNKKITAEEISKITLIPKNKTIELLNELTREEKVLNSKNGYYSIC